MKINYIVSQFPQEGKRMEEHNWESLLVGIIAVIGIIGAILIYNNIHGILFADDVPELHAEPMYVKEVTGGHEIVEVVSETAELPKDRPSKKTILSDEEIMAKVVHEEAKGERLLGQVLVAYTILNRCDYYGETVETVVSKPNQYSYNPDVKPNESCYRAVIIAELIKDFIPDLLPDTLMWFANDGYHTDCGKPYIHVGGHYFNYLPEE